MDAKGGLQWRRVRIVVKKYFTPEGKQTCALDVTTGKMCRFLGTRRFGQTCVCMCDGVDLARYGDKITGFLEPHKECILADAEENE